MASETLGIFKLIPSLLPASVKIPESCCYWIGGTGSGESRSTDHCPDCHKTSVTSTWTSTNKKQTSWYIYTVECYSAIKKNKTMPFAAPRLDLEIIMLTEVSQMGVWFQLLSKSCDPIDCSPPDSSVHGFPRQKY